MVFFVIVVSKRHLGDIIMALSYAMVFIPFVGKKTLPFCRQHVVVFFVVVVSKRGVSDNNGNKSNLYNGVILCNGVYPFSSCLARSTVVCLPLLSPTSLVFSLERIWVMTPKVQNRAYQRHHKTVLKENVRNIGGNIGGSSDMVFLQLLKRHIRLTSNIT